MKRKFYMLITLLLFSIFFDLTLVSAKGNFSINDIEYQNIEEAVNNLNVGETVKVINNLDLTDNSGLVLTFPDNSTLDLNGHTIKVKNMGIIYQGNNLTIKNGVFETTGSYALFIGDEIESNKIIIENVNTKGGINIYNALNVILKNVTSEGHTYYSVWADQHAQVAIESGNYSTKGNFVIGISTEESSKITINGGNFTTTNGNLVLGGKNKSPVIYGGIFDVDPTEYIGINAKVTKDKDGKFLVGYEKNIEISPIDTDEEPEQAKVGVTDIEGVSEILLNSLGNSKIDISNRNIKLDIITENIEVSKEMEKTMKNQISSSYPNLKMHNYFDISINIIDVDQNISVSQLTELSQEIEFSIVLPTNLQNTNRKYFIIRNHNDKIDILDTKASKDGKILTFKSDKFSTYALAYIENEIENPNTGDDIYIYVFISLVSIMGIGFTIYMNKKSKIIL